jgi:hypothetical protein
MTAASVADVGAAVIARRVLDRSGSVDAAAGEALDVALQGRSHDPVVHAAALRLAFAAGDDDLRLARSHPRGWIPGFHELIDCGHLDAAAYVLPRLTAAFPKVPYLNYMSFVFEHLPKPEANLRDPIQDDRDSDAQTALLPGADTAVLAFCGATHQLGISINMMDLWFAQLNCHVVYLRDRRKIGYTEGIPALGHDMDATIAALQAILDDTDARRAVCLGNSAGATGALRYAPALRAQRVLALAPITGGRKYAAMVTRHLAPGSVMPWEDLVPICRAGGYIRARVMYGALNAGDRQQAVRLAELPGVTVEPVPDWESHHLIGGLLRAGLLEETLRWLVGGDDATD